MLYLIILLSSLAFADEGISLSMVPHGKLFETRGRTYILKSKGGSKIQIRYNLDGSFKDASGIDLNRGDELEPGDGLVSLSSVAKELGKAGDEPRGFWILERDAKLGWIYDIQGTVVNAKTGKIMTEISAVDLPRDQNPSRLERLSEAKLKKSSLFQ